MPLVEFIILLVMIAGLFIWNRTESRTDMRHMDCKIHAIQEEMKDFHGRLEKQDAEFKAFMRAEEQKRTQILMNKRS